MANGGEFNPGKWDFGSGKTWGYMLGGAVVGGASGYAGWAVSTSGIPMANTAGIAVASSMNSVGTFMYTGGETPISISLGAASYDFTNGKFGYLGKKGNKWYENLAYGFGAIANSIDFVSLATGGGQNISANSATTKDGHEWWGRSSITDQKGNTLVSVGPDGGVSKRGNLLQTLKNSNVNSKVWDNYYSSAGTWRSTLNNVSTKVMTEYSNNVSRWNLLLNSCVGHTSKALWLSGIPNIYLFHPHMLNLQIMMTQLGIYANPYLYQSPK